MSNKACFLFTVLLPLMLGCQAPEKEIIQEAAAPATALTLNATVINHSPNASASGRPVWLFLTESDAYSEQLLNNRALRTRGEVGDRIIVVLPVPDAPARDQTAMVESTLDALAARGAIDPARLFLLGFGEKGTLALDLAATNRLQVAGTLVFASTPEQVPSADAVISSTFFVVGEREAEVDPVEVAEGAAQWASAAGCTMTVTGANQGIRQRGHYGCRDGATVIFATIVDYETQWPHTRINLVRLIDSFFAAFVK